MSELNEEEQADTASNDQPSKDEMANKRELAMMKFPRRDDESEEAYQSRIDKIALIVENQWQPGQSGNPAGAKRKFTNFKSSIEDALTEGVPIIWKAGEIVNLNKVTRQDLFMKNVVDLLTYGTASFPGYKDRRRERKEGVSEEDGHQIYLSGKDWADFALKFMRYVAPPMPPERTSEVTQVVFDLGTFMPAKVKKTIIKQKTGEDPIVYDEPQVIEGEVIEDGNDQE